MMELRLAFTHIIGLNLERPTEHATTITEALKKQEPAFRANLYPSSYLDVVLNSLISSQT